MGGVGGGGKVWGFGVGGGGFLCFIEGALGVRGLRVLELRGFSLFLAPGARSTVCRVLHTGGGLES